MRQLSSVKASRESGVSGRCRAFVSGGVIALLCDSKNNHVRFLHLSLPFCQ